MKLVKCDLNNCNVNVANSIRKEFELETFHGTNKLIDDYLKDNYQNIIVILYDGMGKKILDDINNIDYFKDNLKEVITSVHPATTTASTTSMQTGLFPAEHNWLGWDTYIPELKRSVTLYRNTYKDTDISCDIPVGKTYMPYKTIVEEINEKGKYKAIELFPFGENPYMDIDDMFKKIIEYSSDKTKKYIYAYYTDPDALLHEFGNDSKEVIDCIKMLNDKSKEYIEKLKNSLVIITADHGHTDIEYYYLEDYSDVQDLLENETSLEPRFCSFHVKKDKFLEFINLYNKYFKNDFILKTKQELLDEKYLGEIENKRLKSTLGDFFFLAKSNKGIKDKRTCEVMKSSHAGITDREMEIPLIIVKR